VRRVEGHERLLEMDKAWWPGAHGDRP